MSLDFLLELARWVHYNEILALAIPIVLAWFLLPRKKVLAQSVVFTVLLAMALKLFFQQPRPCVAVESLVPCPTDFGFPSIHASLAAVFFMGGIGSRWFWLFAPTALLIGYSRIWLGVHSIEQVLGGFALGCVLYLLNWLHVKHK